MIELIQDMEFGTCNNCFKDLEHRDAVMLFGDKPLSAVTLCLVCTNKLKKQLEEL